jgi:hypothetical protein
LPPPKRASATIMICVRYRSKNSLTNAMSLRHKATSGIDRTSTGFAVIDGDPICVELRGAYSPDLNPIEQVFAKIKHLMRRAMERTVESAQDRLVSVLDTIQPNECANYFSGAGYAAT